MKLLFDQNLSLYLKEMLRDLFPWSRHVMDQDVGLKYEVDKTDDYEIWEYARLHELTIVTTDRGFRKRSYELGHPPRVILMPGNCRTEEIERILRERHDELIAFHKNEIGVLDLHAALP